MFENNIIWILLVGLVGIWISLDFIQALFSSIKEGKGKEEKVEEKPSSSDNRDNLTGISKADGPVAVTGASGYIGSRVVEDLMHQGYQVHACVRDVSNEKKVDHLLNLNQQGLEGSVELFESDLLEKGSYDKAFEGCSGIIHLSLIHI